MILFNGFLIILFIIVLVGCPSTQVADVIFLVQCTSRIGIQEFENIKTFLISVVNSTQVADNLIRIGVIVYSGTPNQFSLNQYKNKRQVVEAIKTLKSPPGNDNTAEALGYSLNYFSEEYGGRQKWGTPQMLFIITDGNATDQVNLRARADGFAAKNINVYGIGVARAQESELEMIIQNKTKIFYVDNYAGLQSLQTNISKVLCNATKPGKRFCFRMNSWFRSNMIRIGLTQFDCSVLQNARKR